jgi:DNA-binding Xre family transcriptional regulator
MMDMSAKSCDRVKEHLTKNGIKQAWLASQISISESKLSEILGGKRPLYADVLAKICIALNVSSEAFLK